MLRTTSQIFSFGVIGGIGFLVEVMILSFLVFWLDWGPYAARLASFPAAVTTTWLLNRNFTFTSSKYGKREEYFIYLAIQLVGASINLVVYYWHIEHYGDPLSNPVISLFFGSCVAMIFNFTGSKFLAFRPKPSDQRTR
jgi:putative flippase GtrA